MFLYIFVFHSAVKGKTPQVGDRVLVEAVYNPNMPFKWNAQRIQTLPQLANQSVRKFKGCILEHNISLWLCIVLKCILSALIKGVSQTHCISNIEVFIQSLILRIRNFFHIITIISAPVFSWSSL